MDKLFNVSKISQFHELNVSKYLEIVDKIEKNINDKEDFGNFIFESVKEFYEMGITNNLKPKDESTVFSSVILQNKDEYRVITFSNGTKSLPNKNYNCKNIQIFDSHAEILSIRALKMFLIKCLIFNLMYLNNREFESNFTQSVLFTLEEYKNFETNLEFFQIFVFNRKKKICLKKNVHFHLYISECPCGDASILPILSSTLAVEENLNTNKYYSQTGAKTLDEVILYFSNKQKLKTISFDNSIGQVRSKSMRNDMAKENISFSLSCSDKLMFKNILGIQGKHLSSIIDKIYFSTITISLAENYLKDFNSITNSILRGISLIRREKYIKNILYNEPKIFLTVKSLINNSMQNKKSLSFSSYWYYGKLNFTKIDPITGFKQGTNFSGKDFIRDKFRVDICKLDIYKAFIKLLEVYSENTKFTNIKINRVISNINTHVIENIDIKELQQISVDFKYNRIKNKMIKLLQLTNFLNYKYLKE